MILLSPGLVIGKKFRLDREVARGGMGSVWAAFNSQLETPVAVKFMTPATVGSADMVGRFLREAKAAAQLRSPHVVQIFEHGVQDGLPYIVMELLEGEDLGRRLSRRGRLSITETAEIVTQICKALRRAHEVGIVHRDLKPANVFIARHDEDEIVKVLDFGIAKSLAPSLNKDESTETGTLVGTPHYMSPEQARRSKEIDARSDLWSLAIIAFRALTGKVPFVGDDMINVLVKVCTEPLPLASSYSPDLGPEVDEFFERALNRKVDQRFQTARELADAFNALAGRRSMYSEISLAPYVPPPPGTPAQPPRSSGTPAQPPRSSGTPGQPPRSSGTPGQPPRPIAMPSPQSSRSGGAPQSSPSPLAPQPPRPAPSPGPRSPLALQPSPSGSAPLAQPAPEPGVAAAESDDASTMPLRGAFEAGLLPLPSPPASRPNPMPPPGPQMAQRPEPPPVLFPSPSPSAPPTSGVSTLSRANTETPLLASFAPPSRTRIALVLGGIGALLLVILVAGVWSSAADETPSASASTAVAALAAAPPTAPSSTSEPPSTTLATPTLAATASAAPSATASALPSSVRPADPPTADPRASAAPKSTPASPKTSAPATKPTGAIGGAPKF